MAQIHRSSNGLQTQINSIEQKRNRKILLRVVLAIIFAIGCLYFGSDDMYMRLSRRAYAPDAIHDNFFIIMFLHLLLLVQIPFKLLRYVVLIGACVELYRDIQYISRTSSNEEILHAGLEGENKALALLSSLPESCHVFTNLLIPYDGKTSETDLVVVSPGGLFVIEVKNYVGCFTGDWSNERLTQTKDDRYVKYPYNPVRQVGTHVYRLANYLRERGAQTWVEGCVLFTQPSVQLNVTDKNEKKPLVFANTGKRELATAIMDRPVVLSEDKIRKIVGLLDTLRTP